MLFIMDTHKSVLLTSNNMHLIFFVTGIKYKLQIGANSSEFYLSKIDSFSTKAN